MTNSIENAITKSRTIETTEKQKSNREAKSSTFTAYYGTPENAADLYRALDHASGVGPEDIEYETLQGILYMARRNDLAFTVKQKVLVVGEHQSTVNFNMPIRSAIYYGRTMERMIPPRFIYRSGVIPIPTPEFYVFYNGKRNQPSEQILKLSDSYLEKTNDPMLELKVKVININPSAKHPILEECRSLYEYASFIQQIRNHMEDGFSRDEAIAAAMDVCVRKGIMVDFIKEHGSEVRNMLFTEFNLEDAKEVWYEEGLEEGIGKGIEKGQQKELVKSVEEVMKNFKVSLEEACRGVGVTVEEYEHAKYR